MPRYRLPEKTLQAKVPTERPSGHILRREAASQLVTSQSKPCYKSYNDLLTRARELKIDVQIDETDEGCILSTFEANYITPKYELFIDHTLTFVLRVYGWLLPQSCRIVCKYEGQMKNVFLSQLLKELDSHQLCTGLNAPSAVQVLNSDTRIHVIQRKVFFKERNEKFPNQGEFVRAKDCEILVLSEGSCFKCSERGKYESHQLKKRERNETTPAKPKAPLTSTNPCKVVLALKESRLKCKQLETEIKQMKHAIENASKPVTSELSNDLKKLFGKCDKRRIPDFMKLFWEEQQKYLQESPSQVRYHPMIIKFCLSIAAKSSSAYKELCLNEKTGGGVLVLPSLKTLRDYRNYIKPRRGFNPQVVADLKHKTQSFSNPERYIVLCFDEMKVQEDLVSDKNTGELVGFVDLGDMDVNYAVLSQESELATHILVFLVKSIVNPLPFSFATFSTAGNTAAQMFPIFWRAVAILEKSCNLHVMAAVGDGASSNRSFFKVHRGMDDDAGREVIYRTVNHFNAGQFIYFFSDPPHLMKTARNNLYHSGHGKSTHLLWNNGSFILWSHISHLYYEDLECGLKLMPKPTNDHINLTPYSMMRVHLAVQILSATVANVLKVYGQTDAEGTAEYCQKLDMFFDCLNVRNTQEHIKARKPFLEPYKLQDDSRFQWLEMEFLKYFEDWKKSVEERKGKFSRAERQTMFISPPAYQGLHITCYSFIELTRFLLNNGVEYVLSNRFCQDDLENYFGRQRAIGCRRDNPNVFATGYNDNTIKSQFTVVPISGNVKIDNTSKWNKISEEPLPKRSRSAK